MNDIRAFLRRLAVPLCALLLLVVGMAFPRTERKQRVRVAPGTWPGAETLLLANDLNKLPASRFQVIEIPWSSAVMRALGNGAADVAVVTLDSVLRMRESGQKLRVLMVLDQSTGGDAVLARAGIQDMQGLRAKTVGVDVRGAGGCLLIQALEQAGMTMGDIKAVPLIQSEMEQALELSAVDAVVVSEPWLTRLRQKGLHSVHDSAQQQIPILRVLVASERACAAYRDELMILMKTHVAMTAQIRSGTPFQGMEMVLRRQKLQTEEFVEALKHWKPLTASENAEMLTGENPKLLQLAASMEELMIHRGLLRTKLGTSPWIDPTFFKEAWP